MAGSSSNKVRKRLSDPAGVWKLAYADFATAMMALFLVLWLTAQDERVKEAVEKAFRRQLNPVLKQSVGVLPDLEAEVIRRTPGNLESSAVMELEMLRRLNEDLLRSLQAELQDQETSSVKLELTPDGLLISVFDRGQKPTFEAQSASLTSYGAWIFSTLAWEVSRYTNFKVELEGHTQRGHPPIREDYGSWELSADRANAARRKLIEHGVSLGQIRRVGGFGDTVPLPGSQAEQEINRRVSVLFRLPSHRD
jgi:chemotaxis protein MotB